MLATIIATILCIKDVRVRCSVCDNFSSVAILETNRVKIGTLSPVHCNYVSTVFNEQAACWISIRSEGVSNVVIVWILCQESQLLDSCRGVPPNHSHDIFPQ